MPTKDAKKDSQLGTESGHRLLDPIEGVHVQDGLHVPYDRGVLTEMYRPDWDPSGTPILHIHQVRMLPGTVSAWHLHRRTTDRLVASLGHFRVVLYDDREASPTRGRVNEIFAADCRPALVVIPAGVWHGIENLAPSESHYLNFASVAYDYQDPDHYRVPADSPTIPFSWTGETDPTTMRRR